MQRLCLSDWDGTLRPGFILEDWLEHLSSEGIVGFDFADACRQRIAKYQKGMLPYHDLVIEAASIYASAVKAVDQHKVNCSAERFILKDRLNLFAYTEPLLVLFRKKSIETIVVSGGPTEVLEAYGRMLGFSRIYALRLTISDSGRYTGDVQENHGILEEKDRVVRSLKSESKEVFLALGNAPADQPLFVFAKHAFLIQTEGVHYTAPGTTQVNPQSLLTHVMALLGQKGGSDGFTV
jgi:HAD superfamily phosphoserine phosphatase-like hydrolase